MCRSLMSKLLALAIVIAEGNRDELTEPARR
jgi:hypothetical protein